MGYSIFLTLNLSTVLKCGWSFLCTNNFIDQFILIFFSLIILAHCVISFTLHMTVKFNVQIIYLSIYDIYFNLFIVLMYS